MIEEILIIFPLRFSLIYNSGQDLYISKDNFEVGRNFANKIWNASRLILLNVKDRDAAFELKNAQSTDLATRWIISKYYSTLTSVNAAIESFRYSEAENQIYEFFWNCFCDWYLEIIKNKWEDTQIQNTAFKLLEESLKMMHPFIPFVTEEIWAHIHPNKEPLCLQEWPRAEEKLILKKAEEEFQTLMDVVTAVRNIRATWNISPKEKVRAHVQTAQPELLTANYDLIKSRAQISELNVGSDPETNDNAASAVVGSFKISIPLGDVIDIEKEKKRIQKTLEGQKKAVASLAGRLQNKNFLDKAPEEVVAKEKHRLEALRSECEELEAVIANLK